MGESEITGDVPLKGIVRPWSLSLSPFLLPDDEVMVLLFHHIPKSTTGQVQQANGSWIGISNTRSQNKSFLFINR
jgi:hypothetical protein